VNLFNHQIAAYEQIVSLARTYFDGHWKRLPIKTRWHVLLSGPSGSGKTALAKMIATATAVDAALLRINVTSWMPCGAHDRGTAQTLPLILQHIDYHPRTILFLDELDKAHSSSSSWMAYVRAELYELLDGKWLTGIKFDRDDEEEHSKQQRPYEHLSGEKLRNSTFIIGVGTFQEFFDSRPNRTIGFHEEFGQENRLGPDVEDILKKMPRELTNRFAHLIYLPELAPDHYRLLAEQAERDLPKWILPAFRHSVSKRIPQAIAAKSGCRFIERALAEALQTWREHWPEKSPQ